MRQMITAAVMALGLIAPPAMAQNADQSAGATPAPDEIVVEGHRLQQALSDFVGVVSTPPNGEIQLARWDRRICVSVAGIRAQYGQFMVDRIAQRAFQVGLEAGAPGCTANVLVLVTPDANALAQELVNNDRPLLAAYESGTRGRDALDDFASNTRPVRWWHVAQTVTADGQVVRGSTSLHAMSGGLSSGSGAVVRVGDMGRTRATTRQDFNRVVIIVDATRAQGFQFAALSDYVAMVALAQLDPSADTSQFPSVLNLFTDQAAGRDVPVGMTDWDVAYLSGLYGARRNAASTRQQRRDIAHHMRGEVSTPTR